MKVRISFTEEVPPAFRIKKLISNNALSGELFAVRPLILQKRVWGINILIEEPIRWFFKPYKYSYDTFYELTEPIQSMDELLRRESKYIKQTVTPQSKEKKLYKFLNTFTR